MQLARQRRNQERQLRRMMTRAGAPAAPTPAGQPAISLAALAAVGSLSAAQQIAPSVPPAQYEIGESTLERHTRIRPSATAPINSDGYHMCYLPGQL
eukprot:7107741-Pyramimonas_sp.AAC.1